MQRPPNTVTGPGPEAPAHAAYPAPPRAARLAALTASVLVAIGLWIATQKSCAGPTHSTPSSAEHMTGAATISPHRDR